MSQEGTFHQQLRIQEAGAGEIRAQARVPEGSAWYQGHFPGQPILPGIALLGLVAEAIDQQARQEGRRFLLQAVSRVRFRLPVAPGEEVEILVRRESQGEAWLYPFTLTLGGEPLCSGIMSGSERAGEEQKP